MVIAVLADIHANHIAFARCVEDALNGGAEAFYFLGDYLGDLSGVEETMALLRKLMNCCPCTLLRGNKEDYWLGDEDSRRDWREGSSATGTLLYTFRHLSQEDLKLFRGLPVAVTVREPGLPPVLLCHGSPDSNRGILGDDAATRHLMEDSDAALILCGHTHRPFVLEHAGVTVLNPGAVGVALGTEGLADYLLLRGEGGVWKWEQRQLSYDVEEAVRQMQIRGLERIAPGWTRSTIHLLRHGGPKKTELVNRVIDVCRRRFGECQWANVPEECWDEALEQMGIGRNL